MVRRRPAGVGRKRRPRRHAFPAQEADLAVKRYIYGRVKDDELDDYEMPDFLEDEAPDVYLKNKGLVTIYNKTAQIRRRLIKMLILRRQRSEEAIFLDDKLEMYLHEAKLIQKQIKAQRGRFFKLPKILEEDIILLN
ncbi:uncharacterized protein LOC119288104 isoform X3 [Triticum dicoccoides]|nr:uncharacterized protein LOC119288104 isoform X3 [Triticum dicoccoides]XP_037423624.1 uncharacterized protein LOC119288104 isoform X3 [Triticum dicoccoides]XP_037423625.1 uncharacterized protein LOC119288104 isoform X3 [Triticum dicoccoides]